MLPCQSQCVTLIELSNDTSPNCLSQIEGEIERFKSRIDLAVTLAYLSIYLFKYISTGLQFQKKTVLQIGPATNAIN